MDSYKKKLPKCFCHGFPWDWDALVVFEGGHSVTKCQNLFGTEVFLTNDECKITNYKYHDHSNQKMNISQKMNKTSHFSLIELWGKMEGNKDDGKV